MSSSGLIYAVIVGAWAIYLVPMWLRREDELNHARQTQRYATAIKVLANKDSFERRWSAAAEQEDELPLAAGQNSAAPQRRRAPGAPSSPQAASFRSQSAPRRRGAERTETNAEGAGGRAQTGAGAGAGAVADAETARVRRSAKSAAPTVRPGSAPTLAAANSPRRPLTATALVPQVGRSGSGSGSGSGAVSGAGTGTAASAKTAARPVTGTGRPTSPATNPATSAAASGGATARGPRTGLVARRRRVVSILFAASTLGTIVTADLGTDYLWAMIVPVLLLSAYIVRLRRDEHARAAEQSRRHKAAASRSATATATATSAATATAKTATAARASREARAESHSAAREADQDEYWHPQDPGQDQAQDTYAAPNQGVDATAPGPRPRQAAARRRTAAARAREGRYAQTVAPESADLRRAANG